MKRAIHPAALPLVALLLAAGVCACRKDSPETRIRSALASAETAAQEKDLATLKELISEQYSDAAGRDRRAILGILRYHFLRHEAIHLLTRVREITFSEPETAQVSLFVAMAGEPILGAEDLPRLQADLHRFDLLLKEEAAGAWRVARSEWRRAAASDFF